MSKNFAYEISGIANVNLVLPKNGNWYYQYLKNGNIKIHGRPMYVDTFSPTVFEQNIQNQGGNIEKGNNLITTKDKNMSDEENNLNDENTSDDENASTQELQAIEQQIETFLESQDEASNDSSVESTWSKIELTTDSETSDFSAKLKSQLETKIDEEAQSKITSLLEKIKKDLKKGKVTSAVYKQPSCKPTITGKVITINKSDCNPATLSVTIEEVVDEVKVTSIKLYPISANLFSSEVVLNALSAFPEGRLFLKGLTEYKETFTPKS